MLSLEIPDCIVQEVKLPRGNIKNQLMQELVLRLFERGVLTAVQGARLLQISRLDFEVFLAQNEISILPEVGHLAEDMRSLDGAE